MVESQKKCGSTETSTGKPCQRVKGWGTDHKGKGECKFHEGGEQNPKKLTPKVRNRITGAIMNGVTKQHAAMVAGISRMTLERWLKRGERDAEEGRDTQLASFYVTFHRARGKGALATIKQTSAEFRAARCYGYTKEQTIRHEGEGGGPIQIEVPDLTSDDIEELEAESLRGIDRESLLSENGNGSE